MRVILKENVPHLGSIGDLVNVSKGYARNYLLPRSLVVLANENRVKEYEHLKKLLEAKRLADQATAREVATQIEGFSCTIKRKIGRNDRLFGSVSATDIFQELQRANIKVEKSMIKLSSPLKSLGVHEVSVKVHPDVSATLKVWIAKEGE